MEHSLDLFISDEIRASIQAKQSLLKDETRIRQIRQMAEKLLTTFRKGGTLLIAGNGGSAADAQHIAAEFVGRYGLDRPALPAIALTTDTSILTAVANDLGYENVFARQLESLGKRGDLFLAISTSGNSENLLRALKLCAEKGIGRIGLAGADGGQMAPLCDICLRAPARETPRIQESHILVGHILCSLIELALYGDGDGA